MRQHVSENKWAVRRETPVLPRSWGRQDKTAAPLNETILGVNMEEGTT